MKETPEYSLMFNYMFPINRMTGITNIYSNTYLSSFKNVDILFDATKEDLRMLLFTMLDSGNWEKSSCGLSNRDMADISMNGLWDAIPGMLAQVALAAVKASLLIFKGFMETSDINIIITKRIIDLIHTANGAIAQGQMLIDQASEAAQQTYQGALDQVQTVGSAFGLTAPECGEIIPGACKARSPRMPPAKIFDPIDETFIPEPQTWMVSLALLPATLFAPFVFGPPLTIPYGFIYWALDYKPEPNWLNSVPPVDWLTKLMNRNQGQITQEALDMGFNNCEADLGLPSPSMNAAQQRAYFKSINQNTRPLIIDQVNQGNAPQQTPEARRYSTDFCIQNPELCDDGTQGTGGGITTGGDIPVALGPDDITGISFTAEQGGEEHSAGARLGILDNFATQDFAAYFGTILSDLEIAEGLDVDLLTNPAPLGNEAPASEGSTSLRGLQGLEASSLTQDLKTQLVSEDLLGADGLGVDGIKVGGEDGDD